MMWALIMIGYIGSNGVFSVVVPGLPSLAACEALARDLTSDVRAGTIVGRPTPVVRCTETVR